MPPCIMSSFLESFLVTHMAKAYHSPAAGKNEKIDSMFSIFIRKITVNVIWLKSLRLTLSGKNSALSKVLPFSHLLSPIFIAIFSSESYRI